LWGIETDAVMLETLLKNAGLLIILIGVIILGVVVFSGSQTNTSLALSLVLIIVGLISHIAIGKLVE
jgi:uncharacterized protein YjeT (DUF2065 family)